MHHIRAANRSVRREALFRATEAVPNRLDEQDGRVTVLPPDLTTGAIAFELMGVHRIDEGLAHLPILHLDSTLRPELAETVLAGLVVTDEVLPENRTATEATI